MRVICEKCRSAYAIDDAQVPPTGARTKCPRCSHVQIARPMSKGSGATAKVVALSEAELESRQKPAPAGRDDSAAWDEVVAAAGGAQTPAPAASKPDPAKPSPPPVARPPSPAVVESFNEPRCKGCGVKLTDPFDQALGMCDACRAKEASAGGASEPPRRNGSLGVASPGRQQAAALLPELFEEHVAPEPAASAELTDLHTPKKKIAAVSVRTQQTVVLTSRRSGPPAWIWVLLLLLGVGGAGAGYYFLNQRKAARVFRKERSGPEAAVIARLRARYKPSKRSTAALVVKGRDRLVEDRDTGYAQARVLFAQALIASPQDPDAAFGFAEAVAQGFPSDKQALRDAQAILDAQQDTPRVRIARADVIRALGGPGADDRARSLAQAALAKVNGEDAGWAQLAIGRSYLAHAGKAAVEAFSQALRESGRLVAAYTLRGKARAQLGDYKGALADLQQRLAIDPDHWPTLDALGRIELSVGQVTRARQLYQRAHEAAPSRLEPLIALAQVCYQYQDKAAEAVSLLSQAVRTHASLDPAQTARLQGQLAAAYRTLGDLAHAASAAQAALTADPYDGPAHLQLLLVELARGRAKDAEPHLAPLTASPGFDKALGELITGRVDFAQGKLDEAVAAFEKSAAEDPRRTDALLWAGAALAAEKQPEAAEPLLMRALEAEPGRAAPEELLSDFWIKPGELLAGAEGKIASLARAGTDPMPNVFEAAIHFHQHDLAGANRYLGDALAIDDSNVLGLALKALVLLEQGQPAPARQAAQRSVSLARQVPLAHLALGEALLALGHPDDAKRELEQAHALAPSLAAPELAIARIEAKTSKPAARERLENLLAVDPSIAEARKALFALEVP